jgi:steroid delta-isomerase-like uncharacterized protein
MLVENKLLVQRFIEEFWNQGNMAVADELIALTCTAGGAVFGPEQFKKFFTVVRTAFPDLQFTIEDLIAEEDKVAVRFVEHGTHQGVWMGIPPTGNPITVQGVAIFHIARGQIVHQWSYNALIIALRQVGAQIVPGPTE